MIFGFLFLTISTCFIQWFIPENQPKWISAYRDAMSFRASHYFVSFISEASAVACGFGCQRSLAPQGVTKWEVPVAEPHNIEVPRSLVEVVVSWNKPMHQWLKQCNSLFQVRDQQIIPDYFNFQIASKKLFASENGRQS